MRRLPEQLLESELFDTKGCFTGAQQAKPGQTRRRRVLFSTRSARGPVGAARSSASSGNRSSCGSGTGTGRTCASYREQRDLRKAVERGDLPGSLLPAAGVRHSPCAAARTPARHSPPQRRVPPGDRQSFSRRPSDARRARHCSARWQGSVRELRNALERAAILCGEV
jgi:hypothetical protein